MDSTVSWFPAVSLKALKEEIRLLQEAPWRSIKSPVRYCYSCLSFCNAEMPLHLAVCHLHYQCAFMMLPILAFLIFVGFICFIKLQK